MCFPVPSQSDQKLIVVARKCLLIVRSYGGVKHMHLDHVHAPFLSPGLRLLYMILTFHETQYTYTGIYHNAFRSRINTCWKRLLPNFKATQARNVTYIILLLPHEYSLAIQQFHWQNTYFDMLHYCLKRVTDKSILGDPIHRHLLLW